MRYSAIITAGGSSTRFGSNTNKLLEKINGKEIIKYTVETFLNSGIQEIIICANPAIYTDIKSLFDKLPEVKIIKGGKTRQESVYNGIKAANCDYILIHDGARPVITPEVIKKVLAGVVEKKAVSVMTKTTDTIKEVNENGLILKTIDRSRLYNTQTPQAFEYNLIKSAHEKLKNQTFTDDAGIVEYLGYDVFAISGDYRNIKVTTKSDLAIAEVYLKEIYG